MVWAIQAPFLPFCSPSQDNTFVSVYIKPDEIGGMVPPSEIKRKKQWKDGVSEDLKWTIG